jgi:hypothetical protein
MVGTAVTSTENPQLAFRPVASVAIHITPVTPVENNAPDAGVHATDTGAVPPVVVGDANVSASGCPLTDDDDTPAGHAMPSG